MPNSQLKIIELVEHQPQTIAREEMPQGVVEELRAKYGSAVKVELKDSKTGDRWQLLNRGWAGYIPLTPELGLRLQPKVPLKNIFGMLEYAYQLKSFQILQGLMDCQSLEEYCDRLAGILARNVSDRLAKGLYQAYLPKTDKLAGVRGRLDLQQAIREPWQVKLKCYYNERTGDIEENQILAWTLHCIARAGLGREETRLAVLKSDRALQGFVTLRPFSPKDCSGRQYHRLNYDYQPLHALCRFFLEHLGPSHEIGDREIFPFLVDMAKLYERFVAEWLKTHLPPSYYLKFQERVDIGASKAVRFRIDLVIYHNSNAGYPTRDRNSFRNTPYCIVDTKYKLQLSASDVTQAIAYAVSKTSPLAVLAYPAPSRQPLDEWVGNIRIRSIVFSLDGDLEKAGQAFLSDLLDRIRLNSYSL
ncbi:MAG: restriction endonuclease [Oscillatoria sp. SIO1A7]|nr:restriction endonuclease [Oscillatoria sp. SIO1A7]